MATVYTVIMAGGIGSRFWPMSRSGFPKQFHDVLGVGRSLIQMTYDRSLKLSDKEQILVVTHQSYVDQVKEQLPDLPAENILAEPGRRNTAPCIAYAMEKIAKHDENAVMVVASSDHLILNEQVYLDTIELAIDAAGSSDSLLTIGIKPSRPDTGYGYIQFRGTEDDGPVRKVKTFTEKPNLEIAQRFVDSGEFYWNAGMFVWSINSIRKAFQEYLPEVYGLINERSADLNTAEESKAIAAAYQVCPSISIDYGIMEKADNVKVVLAEDFGWSDLGTWGSLYTHIQKDDHENAVMGKNVMLYDTQGSIVQSNGKKLTVVHGLENYIVVDTEDALLIISKENEQQIKTVVNDLKSRKLDRYL